MCNTWRNYGDMNDDWDSIGKIIDYYGNDTEHFSKAAGPGHWNDPDEVTICCNDRCKEISNFFLCRTGHVSDIQFTF